ncbi:hypothetical protein [Vibrio aestuarianus]|nr:hypothetical protein [Vibrio aestuarianus]
MLKLKQRTAKAAAPPNAPVLPQERRAVLVLQREAKPKLSKMESA